MRALLTHAWRAPPPVLPSLDKRVAELAILGGAGALVWRRIDDSTTVAPPLRAQLRDLYRHQVLEAARFERGLEQRVLALAEVGVRPLVVKGWSIARRYPGKGLRHYSDLDLVVRPDEESRVLPVLARHAHDRLAVDLHLSIPHVDGRDLGALLNRVVEVPLGAAMVRTLGDEDHLWLLALHALGHGLWRPIWLCDLALLLEDRAASLDWDYLQAGARRDVPSLRAALGLARRVLGAEAPGTPVASWSLPGWLEPALLDQWARGYEAYAPATELASGISALWRQAAARWPNPIRATAALHGPWNEWPRAPIQAVEFLRRSARFLRPKDAQKGIWGGR